MGDNRIRVGVFFGGKSPEHEVSVISAHQVIAAMDRDRYEPFAVYVGKDGRWFTGGQTMDLSAFTDLDAVRSGAVEVVVGTAGHGRIELVPREPKRWLSSSRPPVTLDVVFPAFHGGPGESGGIQGLCEMFDVPCAGTGVLGSALGMDKLVSKALSEAAEIPVVEYVGLNESDWADSEDECLDTIEAELGLPVMVKPARLGSSIGISLARSREELDAAVEEAFRYDSKLVVETAIQQLTEINCSVLGSSTSVQLSVLEQPVRSTADNLLSFADKYQRGAGRGKSAIGSKSSTSTEGMASLDRIIPAPVDPETEATIRSLAEKVFAAHDCAGLVRIDFLIDDATGDVFFNEINTIPGSFSFYLWEPAGVPFHELVSRLIEVALSRHRDASTRLRSYDVNLLSPESVAGLAGAKGKAGA
jgi:D-alanine-D-alanine ligase